MKNKHPTMKDVMLTIAITSFVFCYLVLAIGSIGQRWFITIVPADSFTLKTPTYKQYNIPPGYVGTMEIPKSVIQQTLDKILEKEKEIRTLKVLLSKIQNFTIPDGVIQAFKEKVVKDEIEKIKEDYELKYRKDLNAIHESYHRSIKRCKEQKPMASNEELPKVQVYYAYDFTLYAYTDRPKGEVSFFNSRPNGKFILDKKLKKRITVPLGADPYESLGQYLKQNDMIEYNVAVTQNITKVIR